ncbi:MAG: Stp1/IreP family PP2C-type Ser/Thr phosphatase, partial [bacterium]
GLVRQTNEDSYLVRPGLYAVCDGMGGARAGEVASEMACRGLLALDPATAGPEDLREAIAEANVAIARRSLEEERLLGMGTTLTATLAGERSLSLAHVGDSRGYLLHDNALTQLTDDHSWVGEMVRRGELTPAQAAVHPHRSVITKALGTDGDGDPDIFEVLVEAGDRVLLCSDGLTGMVSDPDIAEILRSDEDPQAVAGLLVQAALNGGGEDNVTVVVVDVLPSAENPEVVEPDGARPADEVLLGPTDRGVLSPARAGRGRRPGAGVRGRLGGRVGPLLRPVATGSAGGAPAATSPAETAVLAIPGSPSEAKPAVEPAAARPRGWTRRKWLSLATAIVVVLVIAIVGFAVFNSTVYYVGVSEGTVALYHGLPASVVGIALSSVIERGTAAYDSLAPYLQARVDTHDLVSKEEGQLFLRSLSAQQ